MKRLISIITAAVMTCTGLIGAMPANAQEITNAKTASLDSDISVEGTNSFGNLLSSELDSEVAEQEENNGYNVFSAEVTGTEVTVSFETMSDCTLLAAIYDEAGETLIASGTAKVTEEETEKTVTIETDEMPQYFYLMVYLVDETTMRPMCTAYESPNYTQEMQEFFALTVNDFDSERVLNLDEDETNNFAVYSEDTIIIESDETVNTVTTADIDNENYVIENADSTVTSLQAGDIFVIEQTSGEVLIVKVGEITVDGTTATITGEDAEMEEVFEIVKIDTTQTNEEATVDTSSMSEGVTYEGETNEIQALTAQTKNGSGGDSTTTSLKFSFKFLEGKSDDGSTSVSLSGSVSLSSKVSLKYSISWSRKYVELTFVDKFNFSISISGTMTKEIKLGEAGFSICPGVYVSVVPKIVFEFNMTASFNFTLESTSGFSLEHTKKKGFKQQNLAKKPKMTITTNLEGTFAVGVALEANLSVVSEKIFRAGFEASAKLELSLGKSNELYNSEEHPDSKHTCKVCLEGDLSVKTEISFNAKFLNSKKLSFKFVLASKKAKLKDVYFSIDNMRGGLTTCPYYAYRTDFEITDSDGNAIEGLTLEIRDMSTNEWLDGIEGTRNIYLLGGRHYHVRTYYNGLKYDEIFEVKKAAKHVALILGEDNASAPVTTTAPTTTTETTTTTTETTTTTTDSSVVASGTCGENLTWVLDDEGTLTISGTGDMYDWEYPSNVTWNDYSDSITDIVIEYGVTSIGKDAFFACGELTEITIPDSVAYIGDYAFESCEALTTITIPDSVTSIGDFAFHYCYALKAINVDAENRHYTSVDGVFLNKDKTKLIQYPVGKTDEIYTIPDTVTSIGDYAFEDCQALTTVTIPDSVISIGEQAFYGCYALTEITIPDSVKSIGEMAFSDCYALISVTIPESVTSIGGFAFNATSWLNEQRQETPFVIVNNILISEGTCEGNVVIPDSVTSIGGGAFYYCYALISVTIPDSVTSIGNSAFNGCSALTSVTIPDSVTSIGKYAFKDCSALTSIIIPNSVTSIEGGVFENCDALTSIIIPDSITYIGDYTFSDCEVLTSVTIPDSVTRIGDGAFSDCAALTSVTIPESVISLGKCAFERCDALTEITIPNSVIDIGEYAFAYCDALTIINVSAENSNYASLGGVLFNKEITTLIQYPAGKVDESYIIPNSVIIIRNNAFNGCSALTSVTIPDSVKSIEAGAFEGCYALMLVTISDGVTSIGQWAFSSCSALTTITLPDSITSIGNYAFYRCTALTDVYYTGTEEQWNEISIGSSNSCLTSATIQYNSTGEVSTASLLTTEKNSAEETTLLTESFTDLLPNEVYNFYVMKSRTAENPFSGENLLYVTQAVSDENGGLTVSYIPKEAFETADIFVAGLTRTDISAATVTVPEITYTGEEILVNPKVTLNGQALTEGIDYDIEGGYLVTRPDEYTITISGTGDYTGSVDVTFTAVCGHNYDGKACTICGAENPDYVEPTTEDILLGDVDSDGAVNASDASMVLAEYAIIATGGTPTFSEEQTKAADVNADGATDAIDASSILGYYAYIATGGSGTIEEYLN